MQLTDDEFNKALEIFQEFGPRMRIPIHQRWREVFPEVATDDMRQWEAAFRELEDFAYQVAVQVRDHGLDEGTAAQRIAERYPRLTPKRVATIYNQARYVAMM